VTNLAAASQPWRFVVPFVETLRPATDFDSVAGLSRYLRALQSVTVAVQDPEVSVKREGDLICGRIRGAIPLSLVAHALGKTDSLAPFANAEGSKFVDIVISAELERTSVERPLELD